MIAFNLVVSLFQLDKQWGFFWWEGCQQSPANIKCYLKTKQQKSSSTLIFLLYETGLCMVF